MTKGENHFWNCMDVNGKTYSVHPNQWNLLDQESRDRWEALASDSDEQRETEKIASVRASEKPVKGDDAESEQQRRGK